jgi:uncharacterized protein YecE (DUF72 family)
MEFGRAESIDGVSLRLPPDHPRTSDVLDQARNQGNLSVSSGSGVGRAEVSVGLPNWGEDVARRIYPKGTPQNRRLHDYARMFNSVELNSTGYAYSADLVSKWASQAPSGFRFHPKVPRDITHGPHLERAGDAYALFCEAMRGFGDKLGTVLLQFEERSFGPWRFRELEAFLRAHASRLPLAVEVRHKDWFAKENSREAYFGLLSELGVAAVIVDTPGRRDLVHQRLTAPEAFIRFSGHDRSPLDLARAREWVERIKVWMGLGLRRAHIFTHHVPDVYSADWAVDFILALNRTCGLGLKAPVLVPEAPPKSQTDLFDALNPHS